MSCFNCSLVGKLPISVFTKCLSSQCAIWFFVCLFVFSALPEVTRLWTRSGSGIETESSLISVLSGSDVTIQCQFSGVPIPSVIQWTLNGEPVTVGVVNEGNVSTLSVSGVTSGGVYQCIVESMYGRDFASVYVCVEEQGQ